MTTGAMDYNTTQTLVQEREAALRRRRALIRKERMILAPVFVLALFAWPNFGIAKVQGHSMEPRYKTGDTLYVLKTYRQFSSLHPGDVVVIHLRHSEIKGEEIVKRIVFVQNASGNAPWPKVLPTGTGVVNALDAFPAYASGDETVPPNTILVMGDNYLNSMDSRDFGPIHDTEIDGKVLNP